jgi:hypothetical protein
MEQMLPFPSHCFCIGLPRTGTASMAAILESLKSGHEFMFEEASQYINLVRDGCCTRSELVNFLKFRQKCGQLRIDSATFHHHYIDVLYDCFSQSKYILLFRDCASWLDSMITMIITSGPYIPNWMVSYGINLIGRTVNPSDLRSPKIILQKIPQIIEPLILYWYRSYTKLFSFFNLKESLVIYTNKISKSFGLISSYLEVPTSLLLSEKCHANFTTLRIEWKEMVNFDHVHQQCQNYSEMLYSSCKFLETYESI